MAFSDLLRLELRQHNTGGAHPQWTQQLVHDAVHVVERQGVQDDIIFGPRPLQNQTLHLRVKDRIRSACFVVNALSQFSTKAMIVTTEKKAFHLGLTLKPYFVFQ